MKKAPSEATNGAASTPVHVQSRASSEEFALLLLVYLSMLSTESLMGEVSVCDGLATHADAKLGNGSGE